LNKSGGRAEPLCRSFVIRLWARLISAMNSSAVGLVIKEHEDKAMFYGYGVDGLHGLVTGKRPRR